LYRALILILTLAPARLCRLPVFRMLMPNSATVCVRGGSPIPLGSGHVRPPAKAKPQHTSSRQLCSQFHKTLAPQTVVPVDLQENAGLVCGRARPLFGRICLLDILRQTPGPLSWSCASGCSPAACMHFCMHTFFPPACMLHAGRLRATYTARLAAQVAFQLHAGDKVGAPMSFISPPTDVVHVLHTMQQTLGALHEPTCRWAADPLKMRSAENTYATQQWWADQVSDACRQSLVRSGTVRDVVRLQSQEGPLACAWLTALPTLTTEGWLSDVEFRSLCRWWLGMPLLPLGRCLPPCPECGDPIDPFGDHFVCCQKNGMALRHNNVRDHFSQILSQAGISHAKEVCIPMGNGRSHPFARERPADILLTGWDKGRDVAVDFSISCPTGLSCHPLSLKKAKRHLRDVEMSKRDKEGPQCAMSGWGFHPVSLSPWGGMGPAAKSLIFDILRKASGDLTGWAKQQRIRECYQGLSLTLARGVARQLGSRCKVLDACAGQPASSHTQDRTNLVPPSVLAAFLGPRSDKM